MTTTIEYALLAGAAYESMRDKANKIPPPEGWSKLAENLWHTQNDATGFEAVAFTRGTDIVISFAGTDPNELPDWINIVQMGIGLKSLQLLQAADLY